MKFIGSRCKTPRPDQRKEFEGHGSVPVLCVGQPTTPDFAMNPLPDPLDPLLDRWSETPEPSPRLTANVWQQIALNAGKNKTVDIWATLEAWLGRPAFAIGFVTACALLGLFLAEIRVSHMQRERSAQLARSYLLLIDPLLNAPEQDTRS